MWFKLQTHVLTNDQRTEYGYLTKIQCVNQEDFEFYQSGFNQFTPKQRKSIIFKIVRQRTITDQTQVVQSVAFTFTSEGEQVQEQQQEAEQERCVAKSCLSLR